MTKIVQVILAGLALLTILSGCNVSSDPQSLIAKAQEYRQNGDYKAAIIEFKNVLQENPEHAEARFLLGATYNEAGDVISAEKELRRALDLRYDSVKVVPELGKALLKLGEFQRVLEEVKLEGDVGNAVEAEILTLRALASIGLGRQREARELLDQALAKQPEFPQTLLGQARLEAIEGRLDEAARLIERALASDPKSIEAWLMKGDLARVRGDPASALSAYQKMLEIRPDDIRAQLNIASLHIASGDLAEARKRIAEARKAAPGNVMTSYMQSLIELQERNYTAARDTVLQVLKVAPDHIPSMLIAGMVESALGSHGQAQVYLRRVVERSPQNLYARKLLVSSLARTGQVTPALEVLQAGLRQAPEDGTLMVMAGELYMRSGDFDRAERFFEKAAKRDPKSAIVRTRLGVSRLATGETESALSDLETAVELDPQNYQADVLLVMSHLKQRNYDEALKAIRSLEEKQPNNPLTHNLKAAIYLGKKDVANARKHLERALQLQPSYVPAAVNLARLDLQEKNGPAARRRLEAILEKDKDNLHALIALANFGPHINATRQEQIDWLERARKAHPRSVQPALMLARLYGGSSDWKKALESAEQAQAIAPDNPQVLSILGTTQMGAGQKEQAMSTYRKLVATQPKSHVALYQLGRAQVVTGDRAGAAATFNKALALKPDYIDAYAALFGLELAAARYPAALKLAKQVQKLVEKSPVGFALEGDAWMAQKKYPAAVKAYETAYGMQKNGAMLIKLHAAYTGAGKADEADAKLTQWLQQSPGDTVVRLYAADSGLKRGKYQEAIEHYEWLQQNQRENFLVLNNLAWAYHRTKDARAVETAERAYKLRPDSPAVADTLGQLLMEQGNTKRGIELLQKAAAGAPEAPEIRFHLAQGWLKVGEKTKARDELERLLEKDVKFSQRAEAEKLLQQLRR